MEAGWGIGIDVGGTKIAGGIVHLATGRIRSRIVIPTGPGRSGEALLDDAVGVAARLVECARDAGLACERIGVGVPELVSLDGTITSAHVLPWRDEPVATRFGRIAPTVIESDVRAAARAEAMIGAGRDWPIVAYVTIGTGISSTLVIEGAPFAGARGNALVLASAALPVDGLEGAAVAVEEIASGPGLAAAWRGVTGSDESTAEDVVAAAAGGDDRAGQIIARAAMLLGGAIGQLANVTDPHGIVIGGGLGAAPGPYWTALEPAIRRAIWSLATRELPIRQAAFGSASGLIGAALTAAKG